MKYSVLYGKLSMYEVLHMMVKRVNYIIFISSPLKNQSVMHLFLTSPFTLIHLCGCIQSKGIKFTAKSRKSFFYLILRVVPTYISSIHVAIL